MQCARPIVSPLPLRIRTPRGAPDQEHAVVAQKLVTEGVPMSDVMTVALTPRALTPRATSSQGQRATTPRPVVRGPQKETLNGSGLGTRAEDETLAQQIFEKFDKEGTGKLEIHAFYDMLTALDLHVESGIAKQWLGDLSDAEGLTREEFSGILGAILSAQTPAVRKAIAGRKLALLELQGTESMMRASFERYATAGTMTTKQLTTLLQYLGYPDIYGDGYDRFVGEWLLLTGRVDDDNVKINFHEFTSCINLLVDVCRKHQEEQEEKAKAAQEMKRTE
eukprot:TRINITY_DN4527_c0_g3_i1.p1 TRINITY_DN4527_c0_g3~~TRINITY_DN4527_c0_g3_i1.p1  ORF type:complete len:279 (-),score=49.49 TRINITY_DN4527_c0_g3_i1:168-1004(-)